MSQLYRINPQSKPKNTRRIVPVVVCAWCPETSYVQLKPGEVYTHGMCDRHLAEWTIRVRKRLHH